MTRFEYLAALRDALAGLPPDVIAATVADYEQRISAASAAGQSEEAIMAGLDSPQKVAAECRAAKGVQVFKQDKTPANFVRMFFSFIGLMVFNLLLIVPAIVYSALLFASFAVALACYSGGIMLTATSLAGVTEISLDPHFHGATHEHIRVNTTTNQNDNHVIIDIGKNGKPTQTPAVPQAPVPPTSATSTASTMPSATVNADTPSKSASFDDSDNLGFTEDEHGVNIDLPGLHMHSPGNSHNIFFGNDDFSESRPIQVSIGIGLILAGILMFLLCLVVGKFTAIGIVRLVQMEFAVLKNA